MQVQTYRICSQVGNLAVAFRSCCAGGPEGPPYTIMNATARVFDTPTPDGSAFEHFRRSTRICGGARFRPIPVLVALLEPLNGAVVSVRPRMSLTAICLIACSLMASRGVAAQQAAPQAAPADSIAPSAIEQALIEYACGPARPALTAIPESHETCLKTQLESLRHDFGVDLKRLSNAERKALDSACSTFRTDSGRGAYVACLSERLTALRNRRVAAKAPAPDQTLTVPPTSTDEAVASAPPPTPSRRGLWLGGALAGVLLAGGGVLMTLRSRRAARRCRACGGALESPAELCQKCRHEAADALKRAAAQRAEDQQAQERAQAEESRRLVALEEEQRRERLRLEEEARQREEQKQELARQEGERRSKEDEARERSQAASASEGEFDPYAVLGLSRDAGRDRVLAAYEEAKAKYDPSVVAGLGPEIQAHYLAKSRAVERAYELLGSSKDG